MGSLDRVSTLSSLMMHKRPSSVLVALLKSIPPGTVKVSPLEPPDLLFEDPFEVERTVCFVDPDWVKSLEVELNNDKAEANKSL